MVDERPDLCFDNCYAAIVIERYVSGVLVDERKVQDIANTEQSSTVGERLRDIASFWMIILVSAMAIAAVAIVTPLVLAISAIIGAFDRGPKQHSTWRPAQA